MSTEVQQIIKAVRALNLEQRKELATALDRETLAISRNDLIEAICGKYAHVPTSSEAFAARKREEIALED